MNIEKKIQYIYLSVIGIILTASLALLLSNLSDTLNGYHLGDIAYTLIVYLLIRLILLGINEINRFILSGAVTVLTMVYIELLQYIGLGGLFVDSSLRIIRGIGRYVLGTEPSLLEIGIYTATTLVILLLEKLIYDLFISDLYKGK